MDLFRRKAMALENLTVQEIVRQIQEAVTFAQQRGYFTEEDIQLLNDFYARAADPNSPDAFKAVANKVAGAVGEAIGYIPEEVYSNIVNFLDRPGGTDQPMTLRGGELREEAGRELAGRTGFVEPGATQAAEELFNIADSPFATVGALGTGLQAARGQAGMLGTGEPIQRAEQAIGRLGERAAGTPVSAAAAQLGGGAFTTGAEYRGYGTPGTGATDLMSQFLEQGGEGIQTTGSKDFQSNVSNTIAQLFGLLDGNERDALINFLTTGAFA
jgi:hypothetical protein